jgi:hypothetical protein
VSTHARLANIVTTPRANVAGSAPKILQYFGHVAVRHNESRAAALQRFRARLTWVREVLKDFL